MDTAVKHTLVPQLGLSEEQTSGVLAVLRRQLADHMLLYTKLRSYHWNVTGMQFYPLHEQFEAQYDALAEIVDQFAERIRQFGEKSPGSMTEFLQLATLKEHPGEYPDAPTMIANLLADYEALVRQMREDIETVDDLDEVGVEDLLTGILQDHQKTAWMLRAHLEA